ncbi:hypothetical protein [Litoreibacter roseus]|uniref:Excalibur calcium-binding domain-containing protein n=1 Tax=Litoreibacter roseus TaxID=2601869 RepID=A0A6N6JHM5_9RHOB|nr:hypothetical protein [Litoreibacter roseus]GFE65614.1 hypothetical protein KIN_26880 [Litoreibacter roseus]
MRGFLITLSLCGLVACSPPVPNSASGVGFDNYDSYRTAQQARDAELSRPGRTTVRPPVVSVQTNAPVTTVEQRTAADAVAAVRGTQPAQTRRTASVDINNPGISDEQDFDAVSERQTIESDAQRRAAQSANYKVIQPEAVPNRPSGKTLTPIEFALSTSHSVGQRKYSRNPLASRAKFERQCAAYRSADAAQDDFLKRGGPQRDRKGIDPDGDGYACGWNPSVYRQAVRN